jgi:hypothetical protein
MCVSKYPNQIECLECIFPLIKILDWYVLDPTAHIAQTNETTSTHYVKSNHTLLNCPVKRMIKF